MGRGARFAVILGLVAAPLGFAGLGSGCSSKGAASTNGSGSGGGASGSTGAGPTPDASTVGQLDGAPPDTGLPPLPELTNVVATEREDSVGIDFDPFDGAIDYRVYPLPTAGSVKVNGDGSLTIKNAIYRCAGIRQTFDLPNNTSNDLNHPDAGQLYENPNAQYSWTAQIPTTPTLGYVRATPAAGDVPVYAVAIYPTSPELGWREARPKIYTTDASERASLLAMGGRDDGIVFYVPGAASAMTATVYHSATAVPVAGQNWTQHTEYYFTTADMASHANDTTAPSPAFQVLAANEAGALPLMAVLYKPAQNHVELVAGTDRFNRAANQGPGPLWHVEWSGVTEPTILVVEALASGCPFQGLLGPEALSAPPHQAIQTLAELQAASSTSEVYVNGQFDLPGKQPMGNWPGLARGAVSPVPVARSFVRVTPEPHVASDWDWYEGFGGTFGSVAGTKDPACDCAGPAVTTTCTYGGGGCTSLTSSTLDVGAYELDAPSGKPVLAFGELFGQLWTVFDDTGQDVTGTLRLSAPTRATIASDPTKFLHVTWTVNTVGTDRRYPQLILTDQPAPIQNGFTNANGNFLLVQTRLGPSMRLEVQAFRGLVNGKPWAVNNQATLIHSMVDYDGWPSTFTGMGAPDIVAIPPADPPFEHAGIDRMVRYDAYVSADHLFVFVDGSPAGCMLMPTSGYALQGAVTVTFGDVLYHEGAQDEQVCSQPRPYPFLHEHQCTETVRHWDDLGFKNGVAAPAWDATRFPCVPY